MSTPTPQAPQLDALFLFWRHTLISRYSVVSGIAFFAWDFCITIQDEIEYIWKSPWSFIKFLYLLNRYFRIPSLLCAAYLMVQNLSDETMSVCVMLGFLAALTSFIGLLVVQVILQVRLYALYGRNKFLSTIVGVLCGMQVVAAMSLIGLDFHYVYQNYPKTPSGLPTFITSCRSPTPRFFYALGMPYIIFDFILFALATSRSLMGHLAIPAGIRSGRTLITIMLRDSVIVFVITFLLSVANILTWEYGPPDLYGMIVFWTPLMPGVFANHMLINLRKVGREGVDSETLGAQTTVRFTTHHRVGDLASASSF